MPLIHFFLFFFHVGFIINITSNGEEGTYFNIPDLSGEVKYKENKENIISDVSFEINISSFDKKAEYDLKSSTLLLTECNLILQTSTTNYSSETSVINFQTNFEKVLPCYKPEYNPILGVSSLLFFFKT
jgi:hypothetical protein